MSRQLIRQRTPADDDLEPATEEELRQRSHDAVMSTKQAPALPKEGQIATTTASLDRGDLQAGGRHEYFTGRYAPAAELKAARMRAETHVEAMSEEFGLPVSIRGCLLDLIHILRHKGMAEAMEALVKDAAIDQRYHHPILRLLATIEQNDRKGRD